MKMEHEVKLDRNEMSLLGRVVFISKDRKEN